MNGLKDFFIKLGFKFNQDLKPHELFFENNLLLSKKVKNSIFFYKNSNHANTSFYLFTNALSEQESEIVRRHIWNENKSDLIFLSLEGNEKPEMSLLYAKASPLLSFEKCRLDKFNVSKYDSQEIEKIKHWQFDSGAFWLNYQVFLETVKYKTIDKELIATLSVLKTDLNIKIKEIEQDEEKQEEIVQAFIDRTLYIKYLEDNHIINSNFYKHYFSDENLTYEILLAECRIKEINELFKVIHKIFHNGLFDRPTIERKYFTKEICQLVYISLKADLVKKQLRLFDFHFDVIPLEFISYIYEIFLSEKQKKSGIYYTPKKLAQLIVDDVIPKGKVGKVLDPSCGSGMFLIVAFQKLLENSNERKIGDIAKRIEHRTKLLSENIFGIEKEVTAQRFTLFSLSLQLFRGLDPVKIKEYIAHQLTKKTDVDLFNGFDLSKNIICGNTLDQKKGAFTGVVFDYIVGNPPFFEIKNAKGFEIENVFLKQYKLNVNDIEIKAKDIIGKHQISQCFLFKIKEWSDTNTRFGFVSNSSSFYNEHSVEFQKFFYKNYNIEKIYELSKVKKILFENANENVVALIFSNNLNKNNIVEYYPVDMGLFSEKPFELLIIQEDKMLSLRQNNLVAGQIRLRDFLIGNDFDNTLIKELSKFNKLNVLLKVLDNTKNVVNNGLQIVGKEQLQKEYKLSNDAYSKLIKDQVKKLSDKFKQKYTSQQKSKEYPTPLIKPSNLSPFSVTESNTYLGDISNFQRIRNPKIYNEPKILINRTGNRLKAVFFKNKIFYDFDIYSIFLNDQSLNFLVTAIINSNLINYFVDLLYRKRADNSYPKIGADALQNIPFPKEINEILAMEISDISKRISESNLEYTEDIENQLNELIYDFYDLSYFEKQRIRDYFSPKNKTSRANGEIERYKVTLQKTVSMYLKNPVAFEDYNSNFGLIVLKMSLNNGSIDSPTSRKVGHYILNEIFNHNPGENFLAAKEKIYNQDCVYIIKKDLNVNWSITKAFEDGQEILKHLIPAKDGERIY